MSVSTGYKVESAVLGSAASLLLLLFALQVWTTLSHSRRASEAAKRLQLAVAAQQKAAQQAGALATSPAVTQAASAATLAQVRADNGTPILKQYFHFIGLLVSSLYLLRVVLTNSLTTRFALSVAVFQLLHHVAMSQFVVALLLWSYYVLQTYDKQTRSSSSSRATTRQTTDNNNAAAAATATAATNGAAIAGTGQATSKRPSNEQTTIVPVKRATTFLHRAMSSRIRAIGALTAISALQCAVLVCDAILVAQQVMNSSNTPSISSRLIIASHALQLAALLLMLACQSLCTHALRRCVLSVLNLDSPLPATSRSPASPSNRIQHTRKISQAMDGQKCVTGGIGSIDELHDTWPLSPVRLGLPNSSTVTFQLQPAVRRPSFALSTSAINAGAASQLNGALQSPTRRQSVDLLGSPNSQVTRRNSIDALHSVQQIHKRIRKVTRFYVGSAIVLTLLIAAQLYVIVWQSLLSHRSVQPQVYAHFDLSTYQFDVLSLIQLACLAATSLMLWYSFIYRLPTARRSPLISRSTSWPHKMATVAEKTFLQQPPLHIVQITPAEGVFNAALTGSPRLQPQTSHDKHGLTVLLPSNSLSAADARARQGLNPPNATTHLELSLPHSSSGGSNRNAQQPGQKSSFDSDQLSPRSPRELQDELQANARRLTVAASTVMSGVQTHSGDSSKMHHQHQSINHTADSAAADLSSISLHTTGAPSAVGQPSSSHLFSSAFATGRGASASPFQPARATPVFRAGITRTGSPRAPGAQAAAHRNSMIENDAMMEVYQSFLAAGLGAELENSKSSSSMGNSRLIKQRTVQPLPSSGGQGSAGTSLLGAGGGRPRSTTFQDTSIVGAAATSQTPHSQSGKSATSNTAFAGATGAAAGAASSSRTTSPLPSMSPPAFTILGAAASSLHKSSTTSPSHARTRSAQLQPPPSHQQQQVKHHIATDESFLVQMQRQKIAANFVQQQHRSLSPPPQRDGSLTSAGAAATAAPALHQIVSCVPQSESRHSVASLPGAMQQNSEHDDDQQFSAAHAIVPIQPPPQASFSRSASPTGTTIALVPYTSTVTNSNGGAVALVAMSPSDNRPRTILRSSNSNSAQRSPRTGPQQTTGTDNCAVTSATSSVTSSASAGVASVDSTSLRPASLLFPSAVNAKTKLVIRPRTDARNSKE